MVRWSFARRVALALILLMPLVAVPRTGAQEATPAASRAVGCDVTPRPLAEALSLVATPVADPPFDPFDPPLFPSDPSQPADPAAIAGVTATLAEWTACLNADEPLQIAALYTDGFLTRLMIEPDYLTGAPRPRPPDQHLVLLEVADVRVFPDGRVGAIGVFGEAGNTGAIWPEFLFFAQTGDRWLIDGMPMLDPDGTGLPMDATPIAPIVGGEVPDPATCAVAPRPEAEFRTLTGTPPAPPDPQTGNPTPPPPTVGPADAETAAAMEATAREWVACLNAGDPRRFAALLTDALFRRPDVSFDWDAMQGPLPPAEWSGLLGIFHPVRFADGRAGAVVALDSPSWSPVETFFFVFARVGDRWLIDDLRFPLSLGIDEVVAEEVTVAVEESGAEIEPGTPVP